MRLFSYRKPFQIRNVETILADANLFAESAGGPTTYSDCWPNEEGQSAVLISMWTHVDVTVLDETDRGRHFVTDTFSRDRCHPGAKNVSLSIACDCCQERFIEHCASSNRPLSASFVTDNVS